MAELGVGYISIVPEVSKISPGIAKALKASEGAADSTGASMGGKMSSALGGALKKGAVGVGVAAGGVLSASIGKGLGRLNSIEQAESKLKGLGNSTQQVGSIMENALASVKGTSFGLEEAATTAASLVASGIKPGQELEGVLKTVGDTASIAGRSMTDMGLIFGSVAAKGKLQGDEMLQLMEGGVPVLQLLGQELGKTSEEVSDMVSNGEVDFATFERAMKRGMGGAALEAGNTVQGAFKNMGAAAGRLGATLAGPIFDQAAGAFTGITDAIDGLDSQAKPIMEDFASWLQGTAVPALKDFGSQGVQALKEFWAALQQRGVIDGTVSAFQQLWDAGKAVAPALADIGKSVAQASAALGVSAWSSFVTILQAAGTVVEALAGPLQTVADFMADHPALVTAAVGAWAAFKTIPGMISPLTTALSNLTPKITAARTSFSNLGKGAQDIQKYYASTGREITSFGAKMQYLSSSSNSSLSSIGTAFINAGGGAKGFGNTMKGVTSGAMAGMKSAASGVMGALGGPWGAAMAGAGFAVAIVSDEIQRLNSFNEASAKITETTSGAYSDLFNVLASGGSVVDAMSTKVGDITSSFEQMGQYNDGVTHKLWQGAKAALTFTTSFAGLSGVMKDHAMDDAAENADAAAAAIKKLGMSNEELSAKIVGSAGNWGAFKNRLIESGEGGEAAANSLQKLRDAHEQAQAEIDRLGPAASNAASVLQELATTTGDAADRADKLSRAFMELRGVDVDATEAAADLTEEIDSLNDQMSSAADGTSEFANATLLANGSIDATTSSGSALFSAMDGLRSEMQRSVAAGNDANQVFGQSAGALEQMRQQAGIGAEDWNRLLDIMGMTPEEMTIVADVQADPAKADLAAIANQIKGLGDEASQKPIPIKINDEEAKNKLEQAGFKLQNWDASTGSADLDLSDAGALERYNWWMSAGFPAIDMSNPTAKANLDASGLMYNTDYAKMQLATLDLQRPMPWASMDISSLNNAQLEALQRVGLLDGQTPTPRAMMNISELSAEQQEALAMVFNLAGQTPTPVADMNKSALDNKVGQANGQLSGLDATHVTPSADLNNDGVKAGADDAKSWIASIMGKTVTVTFQAIYQGFKDNMFGLAGRLKTGGYWNGPSYASGGRHGGYQLPTTGPGTDVTDGFLAFDRNNIPAARLDAGEWVINARSSKKYGRELREINNGTFQKLPGYATGGLAHADDIDKFARGLEGKPYVWGGVNWGDCSGAMSAIARFAVGLEPFAGRFATGNEGSALQAMGFTLGRGPAGTLRFGWFNGGDYGGHTAGTLPNGVNVEMGGARGNGQYGGPAAGANDGQFTDHAYLDVPTSYQVANVEGAEAFATPESRTYGPNGEVYTDSNLESDDSSTSSTTNTNRYLDTETSSISGAYDSATDEPTSLSDVAGNAASAFAKGQTQDVLNVFGIPDSPPILQARKEYLQNKDEFDKANEEKRKQSSERYASGEASSGGSSSASSRSAAPDADKTSIDAMVSLLRDGEFKGQGVVGAEEDSPFVVAALGLRSLVQLGDYTKNFRDAFGLEEDSTPVDGTLTARGEASSQWNDSKNSAAQAMVSLFRDSNFTGFASTGVEEDSALVSAILGLNSIVRKGDYTGNFRRAFGLEEDSQVVDSLISASSVAGNNIDVLRAPKALLSAYSMGEESTAPAEWKYDPSKGAEQWRSTVVSALQRVGLSSANADRTVSQIDIESGGNPTARNDWDINAQNGDPSIGLLQVIRSTFEANRDPELPDDQAHPLANIVAALNYVVRRYGGPESIWPTRAGYKNGGYVRGKGGPREDKIRAALSDGEFVVNADATKEARGILEAINSGDMTAAADMILDGAVDLAKTGVGAGIRGGGAALAMGANAVMPGAGSAVSALVEPAAVLGETATGVAGDMVSQVATRQLGNLVTFGEQSLGAVSDFVEGWTTVNPQEVMETGRRAMGDAKQVVNNFTSANPQEMYRLYRREAAKTHGGRIGAR